MSVSFKYVGDDEREIPSARLIVKPGDTFEVDPEVAKGLEGQDQYEKVKKPRSASEKEGDS